MKRVLGNVRLTGPIQKSLLLSLLIMPFFFFVANHYFREFMLVQYDDSYITYRYAQSLALGDGLRFNPSDNTNSASSLLFVLLLSSLHWLTRIPIEKAATVINVFSLFTLISSVVYLILRRTKSWIAWVASIAVGLSIASFGPLVYWTLSGMETTFFMAMLGLSTVLAIENSQRKSEVWPPCFIVILALLAITRVEGVIAATGIGVLSAVVSLWNTKPTGFRRLTIPVIAPVGAFALQLLFYRAYYGSSISDPIYFKDKVRYYARVPEMAWDSIIGFMSGSAAPFLYLALAGVLLSFVLLFRSRKFDLSFVLIPAIFFALALFVLKSPHSDERRYELVLLVPLLIAIALFFENLLKTKNLYRRLLSIGIFCVFGLYSVSVGLTESRQIASRTSTYMYVQRARADAGKWLEKNSPVGSRVVSADIGALSFYNPSNVYLDAAGLANRNQLRTVRNGGDVFLTMKNQSPTYLADTVGPDGVSAVETILSNPLGYYVENSGVQTSCPQLPIFSKDVEIMLPKNPTSILQIQVAKIVWDQC
jgi:hypothetical protein